MAKKKREEREREKKEIYFEFISFNIFCVINVKYKEISWRVRRRRKIRRRGEKQLLEAPRKLMLKKKFCPLSSKCKRGSWQGEYLSQHNKLEIV